FLIWKEDFDDNCARLERQGISSILLREVNALGKRYHEDTLKLIGITQRHLDLEAEFSKSYMDLRASFNVLQKLLRDNGLYAIAEDMARLNASEMASAQINRWFAEVKAGLLSVPAITQNKRLIQRLAAYLSRHREVWLKTSDATDRLSQVRKELIGGLQNNDNAAQNLSRYLSYLEKELSGAIENESLRLAGRRKRTMFLAVAAMIFGAIFLYQANKVSALKTIWASGPAEAVLGDIPPNLLPSGKLPRRLQDEDIWEISKAIENLLNAMQKDSRGLLGLASGAYAGDYLYGHSVNATILAMGLGLALGMDKDNLVKLGTSAILHDIGMVKISKKIREQKESLTPEELQRIRSHPQLGTQILEGISRIGEEIKSAAAEHHERYGGQGYPRGLADDEIHYFARIIGLVDTYEALTHFRAYRHKCLSHEEAVSEIRGLDKQDCFDKEILAAFLKMSESFGKT
ncbi:MAG: HD-GYP domain-containing protein, partial [Candidatus Omnitrophota bacterium]